jgi:hypothetical protein
VIGCSFIELMVMLLVQGECNGNVKDAVRRYREKYSNWRMPKHHTFLSVDHRLLEVGSFYGMQWEFSLPYSVHNVWMEIQAFRANERQPSITTRCLAFRYLPSFYTQYSTRIAHLDNERVSTT